MNTSLTPWKFVGIVLLAGSIAACNGPGKGQGSDLLKSSDLQKSLDLARQAFPTTSGAESASSDLMDRMRGQTFEFSMITVESKRNGVVIESSQRLASDIINSCVSRPTQEICDNLRAFHVQDQETARGSLLNQESVDLYFGFESDSTGNLLLVNVVKLVPNNLSLVESGVISLVADDLTIATSEDLGSGVTKSTSKLFKRRR